MKRLSIILTLLGALCLSGYDLLVFPTVMVNLTDQINFVMPNRGLQITTVSKVERLQPFSFNIAIGLKKPLANELKLIGEVVMTSPDGKQNVILKDAELFNLPAGTGGVIFAKRFMVVSFDPPDKNGKYTFLATLKDPSGKYAVKSKSVEVELVDTIINFDLMDKKEFDQIYYNYYRRPRPDRLLAALNYFLNEDMIANRQKKRNYNPLPELYGFAKAFQNNPQFFDELAKMSGTEKPRNHYMALLFSGIGKTFLEQYKDKINPHILAQVKKIKRNPMEVKQITAPVHMDMLFNEFIFTGKFAPVKMLTGELVKRPSISIDEYKQLVKNNQKPTREQLLLVRNTVFKTIAVMGINNIVSKHVLLQYYLETILRRKLDTDEQSAKIIAALLKNAKSTQGNKK